MSKPFFKLRSMTNLRREHFRSDEEFWFYWWILEMIEAGYIEKFEYETTTFILSKRVNHIYQLQLVTMLKELEREVISKHTYTPDFKIWWTEKAINKATTNLDSTNDIRETSFISQNRNYIDGEVVIDLTQLTSYVEIKPNFDKYNSAKTNNIDRKWVYDKFGIYVNQIRTIPRVTKANKVHHQDALFMSTFIPKRYRYQDKDNTKTRSIKFPCKYIKDWAGEHGDIIVDNGSLF